LLAIEYVDVRGDDGQVRKYRIVAVDGRLYPVHLAIAPQWKVHYFSAPMADSAENRGEEERYLADPAAVLGANGVRALEEVVAMMDLDYCGIDFALGRDGVPVVFEANATMAVYVPRVIDAVRAMLVARAASVGYVP
jgi:hypothetical protein